MSNPLNGILGSSGGGSGGSGDVVGPASATDFGIAYFDDTTGKLLASSAATITAAGSLTIPSAETIEFSTDAGFAREGASHLRATNGSTGYGRLDTSGLWIFHSTGSNDRRAFIAPAAGTGMSQTSGQYYAWASSTTDAESGIDTSLVRNAAAVVRVADGSTGIGKLLAAVLVEANTAGSGTPNAIAANESGTVFTNEGVTAKNYEALPTAVAGYRFTFIVQDADGMRIVANTDDTIRVIDKVTAASGYIESTTIGSTVTLVSINAVEWYAVAITGVWTDGTFTYDDTSLTTP